MPTTIRITKETYQNIKNINKELAVSGRGILADDCHLSSEYGFGGINYYLEVTPEMMFKMRESEKMQEMLGEWEPYIERNATVDGIWGTTGAINGDGVFSKHPFPGVSLNEAQVRTLIHELDGTTPDVSSRCVIA